MRNDCRRIVRTLRSGVVTNASVEAVSVGTEAICREISERLTGFASRAADQRLVLVRGDWGTGKSHLRMLCEALVRQHKLPYIQHSVDGQGGSLAHIHRCIPRWLNECSIGDVKGLPAALEHEFDVDQARRWSAKSSTTFAQGLAMALNGWPSGWLLALGHMYTYPDSSYQREKALAVFHSAVEFIQNAADAGVVILLDELENVSRQWDIRGRRKSYEMLERLSSHPGIFVIAFVTDRFFGQVQRDYDVAQMSRWVGWTEDAKRFTRSLNKIPVYSTPSFSESSARELVIRISNVYARGYGNALTETVIDALVREWRLTATKSVRLLVRSTISALDQTVP
jgi:P-loop Domain of unknown function (DUF2791)